MARRSRSRRSSEDRCSATSDPPGPASARVRSCADRDREAGVERAVRPARLGVTARLRRALGPSGCPPPRALVGERCAGAATRPDVGVAGRRLVFGVANDIAKDGARSSARGYRSRLARRIPLPLAMRRWTVWLVRAGPGQCQSSIVETIE